jgi:hypothetical protein
MRKKLSLLILSVVLLLSLASCAEAEISYGFYVFQSGEIVQAIDVKIDGETVRNTNYDAAMICEIVGRILESADYAVEIYVDNVVHAERYFESRTDWNIYYGITGDEAPDEYDEDFYKVGGVFFDEYISKGPSPFADIEDIIADLRKSQLLNPTGEIDEDYSAFLAMIRDDLAVLDYELFTYVYTYNTYLDSVKFKDVDETSFDEKTGLHTFTFVMDHNSKGRIIESSQKIPNVKVWFLTAAGVAVVVVLAVYGISFLVKDGKAKN